MSPKQSTGPRPGPRPLGLHLTFGNMTLLSCFAALPTAKLGSLPWSPGLKPLAESLGRSLAEAPGDRLFVALAEEVERELAAFFRGLQAYRHHPYRRDLADPPTIWSSGAIRLLDYGATDPAATAGWPVVFVPSLVNPSFILDLSARNSLLRHLAGRGLRPLLLDWGRPGPVERGFDLEAYVTGPLLGAIDAAARLTDRPVGLVGYCMGGTLALAAAQLRRGTVGALGLLAAPWDFHAEAGAQARLFLAVRPALEAALDREGVLPVDSLQGLFLALDPTLGLRKFARFARLPPDGQAAENFVALEDWLNEGPDLAGPLARDCLIGWYGENRPARRRWRIGETTIDPSRIDVPSLVVVPQGDRIVPPGSARPVADLIPDAQLLEPPAGHIGMVAGGKAARELWAPLGEWLLARAKSL